MKIKDLKLCLKILSFITLVITLIFILMLFCNFSLSGEIDWGTTGQVGDFFGGVIGTLVAAIGFILIYLSFVAQTKAQRQQEKQFLKSQIEGRFFELVKLQRANIEELVYRDNKGDVICTGRRVFKEVYIQIKEALKYAEILFKIYPVKDCLNDNELSEAEKADISIYAKIVLAYSIVFFGVSKDDDDSTVTALNKHFKQEYSKIFYQFYRLIPSKSDKLYCDKWEKALKDKVFEKPKVMAAIKEKYSDEMEDTLIASSMDSDFNIMSLYQNCKNYNKRFGGHQHKLGHYFRHIFQTIRYIDEQSSLTYSEKYDYLKTFRAQLSNYEQMVFFYNSIHSVGRALEMEFNFNKEYDKYLISKYNFIKNIPDIRANNINISNYYPLIDFEFEAPSETRQAISNQYWGNN